MDLRRGMRDKLEKYLDTGRTIEIVMETDGGAVYDYTCFGVDDAERLSDDRYMIFYNQTRSPNGEITGRAVFRHAGHFAPVRTKISFYGQY